MGEKRGISISEWAKTVLEGRDNTKPLTEREQKVADDLTRLTAGLIEEINNPSAETRELNAALDSAVGRFKEEYGREPTRIEHDLILEGLLLDRGSDFDLV